MKGQNQILASAVATFARIDETTLQPGKATQISVANIGAGFPEFQKFLVELAAYENLPLPREREQSAKLLKAAADAKAAAGNDQAMLGPINEVLEALEGFELRDQIMACGHPPWDQTKARAAAAAKIKLDMLSIPPGQRQMTRQGGGMNESFWIKRSGNDGSGDQKSFLVKPVLNSLDRDKTIANDGYLEGGDAIREALACYTAKELGKMMKLDLVMPETHQVELPPSFFPQRTNKAKRDWAAETQNVVCSAQEAKAHRFEVRDAGPDDRARVPAAQCAAAAMLDLVILNTDRNIGNVLIGNQNELIPIDHGLAFAPNHNDALERINQTMGTSFNALLSLPGTHRPMTDEMAAGAKALDPLQIANAVFRGVKDITANDPKQADLVSEADVKNTIYSARFLKVAGTIKAGKRRLSPAAVQIAFGANARELMTMKNPARSPKDEKAFDKRAAQILKQALADQDIIEQTCLMDDAAWGKVTETLGGLGWVANDRNDLPSKSIGSDPALCMKLFAGRVRCPEPVLDNCRSLEVARAALDAAKVNTRQIPQKILDAEIETLRELANMLPTAQRNKAQQEINTATSTLRTDAAERRRYSHELTKAVLPMLEAEFNALVATYGLTTFGTGDPALVNWALHTRNPIRANRFLQRVKQQVAQQQPAQPQAAAPAGATNG